MAFEDDQSTTFKLTLHPVGPTRLASFDALPPWADLADRAAELFRVRRAGLRVSYVDADGDTITLDSEPELALFYANAGPAVPGANVIRFTILAEPADEDNQDESETEGSDEETGPFFSWPFPPHWGGHHPRRGGRGGRGGRGRGGHWGFPHMPFPPFTHHHHHHPAPPIPPPPPHHHHHHHSRGGHRHHGAAAPPSPPTVPVHPPSPGPPPPPFPGHAPSTPPAHGDAPHDNSGDDDGDDGNACPCANSSSGFPTMADGFGFGRGGAGRRRNGSRHNHSHRHPFFGGAWGPNQSADPRSFFGGFGY